VTVTRTSPSTPAARPGHRKPRTAGKPGTYWPLLALGLLAALGQLQSSWVAQVVMVPGLLILPGVLLLRALRISGHAIAAFPAYVPCASLIVLFASGLAVDLIGPLAGVAAPLRPHPLLAGLEICCLGLHIAGLRAGPDADIPWGRLERPARLAWPLLLPVLAVAGALRLNASHGGAVAVTAVLVCGAVGVSALIVAPRVDPKLLTVIIYSAALTLMWGYSLRGDVVYGYDIASEYHVMQQTVQTGIWHTAHVGDAYGALLSVTVLPAELHALSGMSGLILFKAVYPAIAALLPVMVFHLARRVLAQRWAFLAAAVVISQETFFQELPGLARQEISLVMFAVLVVALLDTALTRVQQMALVALFGLGMAVSHYSTTYFAIGMLVTALVVQWIVSWFREMPRFSPVLTLALGTAGIGAAVWYGLVTRSASNVSQLLTAAGGGLNLLPAQGGGGLIGRYLAAGSQVPVSAAEYARQVATYYARHLKWVHPLPSAARPMYALRPSSQPPPAVRWQLGHAVENDAQLIIEQLMNLVAAVGALLMVLRRDSTVEVRQVGLLGLGTLGILAIVRISGTAAAAYNPERAFLQALVVLGIGIGWVLQRATGATRRRQVSVLATATVAVAIFLAGTSGLSGEILGGGVKTNMADSGTDYEQFDMSSQEIAAASWVGEAAPASQPIYSDRYGQLRLFAAIGDRPALLTEVTPRTLSAGAWIYADRSNVQQRTGLAFFENEQASYAFPFNFLNAYYSLVYTNGSSEVYHR
jgi:uncharacterized membrane protein